MTGMNEVSKVPFHVTLVLVGAALLCMAAYSTLYRLEHPSLTRQRHAAHSQEQGDMMGMVGQLMQRLEKNPQDASALQGLGQAFMRMQAWSEAERFFRRLLEVNPDDVQARQQLSMCLFRQEEYSAAAEQLTKVLAAEPDNAYALFNLGVLSTHYLNNTQQGRDYFRQVLDSPQAEPDLKDQAREQLKITNGG